MVKAANPAKVSEPGASASSRAAPARGEEGEEGVGYWRGEGEKGGKEEGDEEGDVETRRGVLMDGTWTTRSCRSRLFYLHVAGVPGMVVVCR